MFTLKNIFCALLLVSASHLYAKGQAGAKKKKTEATTEKKTSSKKSNKKSADTSVVRDGGETRSSIKNIAFLKSFQPNDMNRLKNALNGNNNTPFTIVDAFVVQPMFLDIQYDITAAIQAHASAGLLCLPQNLRSFIGNQGTEPYMYVAKILFIMGGTTYNLCYRNDFIGTPITNHEAQFADMVTTCSPHIYLP